MVNAVDYCHDRSIAHRDIKLENIIINKEGTHITLIDFGFSTQMPANRKTKTYCGTKCYMAPEIVLRKPYTGMKADVWALGVLLYVLL